MGRYLSVGILGVSAALSASIIPQFITVVVALLGNMTPVFENTRGQLSLVMLFVICWSLRSSLSEGMIWALVGGLMLDMLSILPLGATSAVLVFLVFFINSVARQLFRVRVLMLLVMTPVATVILTLYSLLWLGMLGNSYDIPALLRNLLLPTMIYNLIAVVPIYVIVRLIQRRLEGGLQITPQSLALGTEQRSDE